MSKVKTEPAKDKGATDQQVKAINKALEVLKRRAWTEL